MNFLCILHSVLLAEEVTFKYLYGQDNVIRVTTIARKTPVSGAKCYHSYVHSIIYGCMPIIRKAWRLKTWHVLYSSFSTQESLHVVMNGIVRILNDVIYW